MRNAVLFVHILAAILAFGPAFQAPAILAEAERDTANFVALVAQVRRRTRLVGPLSGLVLLAGVWLIFLGDYSDVFRSQLWLHLAIALFVVATVLVFAVIDPRVSRLAAVAAAAGAPTDEYRALKRTVTITSGVNNLIVVAVLGLMVWQPTT